LAEPDRAAYNGSMPPRPRVFTIPASAPFLPTLIRALREGTLTGVSADPLGLASTTLFLPTRRACTLARAAFLDELRTGAAVLPRIVPLGEIDDDELIFAGAATNREAIEIPEAIGNLERRLLLARLILRWIASPAMRTPTGQPLVANTPASALALADALARLMDDMTTRQVPWSRLDDLVPRDLDEYWQSSLKFLRIANEYWSVELKERHKIDPAERRDLLIEAERGRLATHDGPVIAAGSTGSMPATAKLLTTIATLPHGAVVLPGLDTELDDAAWTMIGGVGDGMRIATPPVSAHPQLALHALLRRIGIARDEVLALGASGGVRSRVISEAMRPSGATEQWAKRIDAVTRAAALDTLAVIEAANPEEEALAIAVALREAVHQHKTAALVTPDRALARRVGAALGRWNLSADDSGGDPLPETEAGVFARLTAAAALDGLAPVTLLALMKHARFRLGAAVGAHAGAIAALELAILRGPRPKPGAAGLAQALGRFQTEALHGSDPRRTLTPSALAAARTLVDRLAVALAPLEGLRTQPFAAVAALHAGVLAALSRDGDGNEAAFAGQDGAELARAFEDIAEQRDDFPVAPGDYIDLFETALADRTCRRAETPGAHVRILGPLEARLVSVDRVVLGGLVEGVWPPDTRTDPWLSRPMRLELGLDLPERRVGLSAHDFAQLLGLPEVILTRAAKLAGAPTVASRFTQRLAAVAGETEWKAARERGERYVGWARDLDRPAAPPKPVPRPRPTPPLAARPSSLSVTQIEDLLRDPYTIYARHILKLRPLDAVDTPPGARDRGTVIHGAIGDFTSQYAAGLPVDPLGALLALGEEKFAVLQDYPEARAFWWPRFQRIARWFIGWEAGRRADAAALHAEVGAKLTFAIGKRTFSLVTRADRIERRAGGSYAVLDYKTGQVPSEKQVRTGLSPQLTLEGAMLRAGAFADIPAGASVNEIAYVSLRGGDPPGAANPIDFKEGTPDSHSDRALAMLKAILARFENVETPYRSLVSPMWKTRYGDYDHLARIKEWSAGREEEE
jgi:ATP-dependent helicase/nuclease subunit B